MGEVTNAMSHVTATLCLQPPPSTIPQPAPILHPRSLSCRPCLAYPILADTNLATPNQHDPTPASMNRHRRVEPNASIYNQPRRLESSTAVCDPTPMAQRRHLQPNTIILSPTLACTTSTDLYNPTLACRTPIPTCRALIRAKHRHVHPNASERQTARIWWERA